MQETILSSNSVITNDEELYVTKRNNEIEALSFDKILNRLSMENQSFVSDSFG